MSTQYSNSKLIMIYFQEETKEDDKTIKNCTELMTKLESDVIALETAILGKFGQQLFGVFKDSLECAICKELVIKVTI